MGARWCVHTQAARSCGASAQPTGAVTFNGAQAGLNAALHVAFLRASPSLDWAFCEAVLSFLRGCPGRCRKKQWAFCEAVLAGIVKKQAALHVCFL